MFLQTSLPPPVVCIKYTTIFCICKESYKNENFIGNNLSENENAKEVENFDLSTSKNNIEDIMKELNLLNDKDVNKEEYVEVAQEVEEYKRGTFEKQEGHYYDYDVLGQIFETYILVRKNNELEIYDQHIIHERILYEELKDKFYNKKLESQHLILPQKMEVNEIEKNIIFDNIEIFNDFGFDIDELHNEIVFRAVPAFDFRDSIQNVFLKLLSDVKEEREIKDLRENIIISMSCKGAVKAGQKLSIDEMKNIVVLFFLLIHK